MTNVYNLNMPGLWAPVLIRFSRDLSRYLEHHVLAALGITVKVTLATVVT